MTESFIGRQKDTAIEPEIIDKLYELLVNYERLKYKVDRTKLLVQNLVKPDSFSAIAF